MTGRSTGIWGESAAEDRLKLWLDMFHGITLLVGEDHVSQNDQCCAAESEKPRAAGILRRNLKGCLQQVRIGYISLIHSLTQYRAALWDHYLKKDINQLQVVQWIAARWIKGAFTLIRVRILHRVRFLKSRSISWKVFRLARARVRILHPRPLFQ